MVKFFKDDPDANTEESLDLEMQSLREMLSPTTIAKTRLSSSLASPTVDGSAVENGATHIPISSPQFQFPPPPVFLAGSLGDKQLKLLHAGNVKLKILILVLTLAIVAGVALGIWIVLTYHTNDISHAPKEPSCVELAATLEDALQAITRLSELVTTLTSSTKDSSPLTSSSNTSVASNSWSNRPRYTWG